MGPEKPVKRRTILRSGVVGTAALTAGCQDLLEQNDISDVAVGENEIGGQITDIHDQPVVDAEVKLYRVNSDGELEFIETDPDQNGEFSFESLEQDSLRDKYIINPEQTVLHVRSNDWFQTLAGDFEGSLGEGLSVQLKNEFIFGPEIAEDADSRRGKMSLLTVWRELEEPNKQNIFMEITNLRDSADHELYEITGSPTDLASGTFLLTVEGDHLQINFGPQSEFWDNDYPPVQVLALQSSSIENPELDDWHPYRTGFPLFEGPGSGYTPISSTASDGPAEAIEEGLGMIARGVPGLGTILNWMDVFEWSLGTVFDREAVLGETNTGFPNINHPGSVQEYVDPNTHTTAMLGWQVEDEAILGDMRAGSVVCMVPMEFRDEIEETSLTARAEWTHATTGKVSFNYNLSIDVPTLEEQSNEGDTIGDMKYDQHARGFEPDANPPYISFTPHIDLGNTYVFEPDGAYELVVEDVESGESVLINMPSDGESQEVSRVNLRIYDGDGTLAREEFRQLWGDSGTRFQVNVSGDTEMFSDGSVFSPYVIRLLENGDVIDQTEERWFGTAYLFEVESTGPQSARTIRINREPSVKDSWEPILEIRDREDSTFGVDERLSTTENGEWFEVTLDLTQYEQFEDYSEPSDEPDRMNTHVSIYADDHNWQTFWGGMEWEHLK